ncbi:hypothetical protein MY11210_002705 [Beauveria gryllotalpidicola]
MQNFFPSTPFPPLPRWTSPSGRFLLVGDAAHAMSFLPLHGRLALGRRRRRDRSPPFSTSPLPSFSQPPTDKLQTALGVFEHARKDRVRELVLCVFVCSGQVTSRRNAMN